MKQDGSSPRTRLPLFSSPPPDRSFNWPRNGAVASFVFFFFFFFFFLPAYRDPRHAGELAATCPTTAVLDFFFPPPLSLPGVEVKDGWRPSVIPN